MNDRLRHYSRPRSLIARVFSSLGHKTSGNWLSLLRSMELLSAEELVSRGLQREISVFPADVSSLIDFFRFSLIMRFLFKAALMMHRESHFTPTTVIKGAIKYLMILVLHSIQGTLITFLNFGFSTGRKKI
jgi:hypothetical protein